jgi:hypothetical protein
VAGQLMPQTYVIAFNFDAAGTFIYAIFERGCPSSDLETQTRRLGRYLDSTLNQFAHVERNAGRRAYSQAEFWDERTRMMQWWVDHLDDLKQNEPGTRLRGWRSLEPRPRSPQCQINPPEMTMPLTMMRTVIIHCS